MTAFSLIAMSECQCVREVSDPYFVATMLKSNVYLLVSFVC